MFRYYILGLLRRRESVHGYALMKEYNRRTGRDCGTGYFYRQLAELSTEGYVCTMPNPQGADTRRTPYGITEAGREAFDEWFEDIPHQPIESDVERVARAMFLSEVEPDVAKRVLGRWRHDLLRTGKILEGDLKFARTKSHDPADIRPMLIRRDMVRVSADLEFLDEVEEAIALRRQEVEAEAERIEQEAPKTRSTKSRRRAAGA